MPTTINAAGRRKVRCPKCTALLTEPETQIYECPICLTLLLAKGNSSIKPSGNRALKSGDEILEGGSKLEKAILVRESGNESEGSITTSQEGYTPSDLNNLPRSEISFSEQKTDIPPDTPHMQKSLHDERISLRGGSGHRSLEPDSASHSESEADVDSPLWSSENANIGEVPEVSSFESSSLVDGSSEHLDTPRPSLSRGPGGNDGAQSLEEGSKFELAKAFDTRSSDRDAGEETEHEGRHPNLPSYEIAPEEEATVEEKMYLDSTIRNSDAPLPNSSGKSLLEEEHKAQNKNYEELAIDKDAIDNSAGSTGFRSPQNNSVGSTLKERVSGMSKQHKDAEISQAGKFGLFDLSVFGIYNDDMYSELRRGKAACYSELFGSGTDGDAVQSMDHGDLVSHSHEGVTQSSSQEQDHAANSMAGNIAEHPKGLNVLELVTDGSHLEGATHNEVHLDPEQDMGANGSGSTGQEVNDGGSSIVGDVGLHANSPVDSDALAKARYGDDLGVGDLSMEAAPTVDISFGDWHVQQVEKPALKSLQAYLDEDSLYEKGMLDLASGEGTDSSWDDDDEELTFSSTLKESSKLKSTSQMDREAQAPPSTGGSTDTSPAKPLSVNPALPFRTTAMQKLLQRKEQESAVQTHLQEADSELYEAPYVENYTPPLGKDVHESANLRITALTPELKAYDPKENKPQMITAPEKLEDKDTGDIGHHNENLSSAYSTLVSNVGNEVVSPTALSWKEVDVQENAQARKGFVIGKEAVSDWKEKDVQTVILEDMQSGKEFGAVSNPQKDVTVDKIGTEMVDLDSQNVDYFKHRHTNKEGSAPGKPVSLRWKGRSSTHSLSSTEDDGAYGMDSEAGSGPDRDTTTKQGVGLIEGHGIGQLTRGHYQPVQQTWLSNADADQRKHGSGELATSRRSARTRASNARLSNRGSFEQVDQRQTEGRISNLEMLGQAGLDRPQHVSTRQSQAANLNRSMLDQGSNYSYNGMAGYNSDHSSLSQEVPSLTQYGDAYLLNPYGLPAAGSTQDYPFQVPPEPHFTHLGHHCASPTCSLCMQQQYYMQQPQMLQSVMMQQCVACASQSSGAAYYQPVHHGVHSHHTHGLTYVNPSLGQHDSGVLSVQAQRHGMHHSHPLPPARKSKLYPPLPGKDAPPYVLCRHCNQLLQVPGYLAPMSGPIQKLQCGSCEKISKFSVRAASPSLSETSDGLAMHASEALSRGRRYRSTASIHSSDRIPSSGLATSAQNSYGMATGHGSHQDSVENRMYSQSGASQTESLTRHHSRPMAHAPEQYRSYGQHSEGEHFNSGTRIRSEGYLSSSPGSSPGRTPQMRRQHQQAEPLGQRKLGFGERTQSPEGSIENRSRFSSTSLQVSPHDPYFDSPHNDRNEHVDQLQYVSNAGSHHNQPADANYSGRNALRSRMEHVRNMPAAPGSPVIEHLTHDAEDGGTLEQRHMLQNVGNGSRSTPRSTASESHPVGSLLRDLSTESSERSHERDAQDAGKGPKPFAGLFKRTGKDAGRGGHNGRKVVVNGHVISEAAVRKAEELAGPIYAGSYWYDYQAGFWGVMGGPCLGILMPFIEEFNYPLARGCARGSTDILVNGRELHEKDLEILAKRGLPKISGKAYTLEISGALFDNTTHQPMRGLGKLAPSIEKRRCGFGMSPRMAQP